MREIRCHLKSEWIARPPGSERVFFWSLTGESPDGQLTDALSQMGLHRRSSQLGDEHLSQVVRLRGLFETKRFHRLPTLEIQEWQGVTWGRLTHCPAGVVTSKNLLW